MLALWGKVESVVNTTQTQNKTNSQPEGGGLFGFDLSEITKVIGNAVKVQKQFDETGEYDEKMLESLNLDNLLKQSNQFYQQSNDKAKLTAELNKKARVKICQSKCPECDEPFNKRQEYCRKCGTSVMIESYED